MVIRYPGRIREFETNAYIICIIIIRISHTEQLIINHCATARRRRAPGTSGSGGARPNIPSPPRLPNPTLPRRCSPSSHTNQCKYIWPLRCSVAPRRCSAVTKSRAAPVRCSAASVRCSAVKVRFNLKCTHEVS